MRERAGERERGRERGNEGEMERWSAVAGSEGGGENKERPCCAPDSSCCSFSFLTGSQCFVPFSFFVVVQEFTHRCWLSSRWTSVAVCTESGAHRSPGCCHLRKKRGGKKESCRHGSVVKSSP